MFATDAGGVGLNLQHAASCCVHFDLPWNPAVFEQRVGRIWRLGQADKVDVYSLVSEDCIESRMAEILKAKHAAFTALFDGGSDEVRFERRSGFLGVARNLVAAEVPRGRATASAERAELDAPPRAPAAAPVGSGAAAVIDPARVRSVLAGLTVQPRADGGMVLEADRESAAVLAEVLRGLAGAIAAAVGGGA